MEYQYLSGQAISTSSDPDNTIVLNVDDLLGSGVNVDNGLRISAKEVVQFVVLKYDSEVDTDWTVPDPTIFRDLLGLVDTESLECDHPCKKAFRWGNLWGRVGLVGLSTANMDHIIQYRKTVENQILRNTRFTLFPRGALEKKGNLTVLLREGFRTFDVTYLPKAILLRSPLLRGGLRVTHIKHYADDEYSRTGACKAGWRLVLLQGCTVFMESLKNYDQDHKFPLASGHVLLRGGPGRKTGQEREDRASTRAESPADQAHGRRPRPLQHHHQRRQQHRRPSPSRSRQEQRQRQRQRTGRPGSRPRTPDRSRNYATDHDTTDNYDRHFPKNLNKSGRSARGRGKGQSFDSSAWSNISRGRGRIP